MTQSINFYSEIPATKSLDITFGSNSSTAPLSVLCDLFVVYNFLCTNVYVRDARCCSCPRSAQRFGRRVAGQIYVCGWKAGALCWGRETVFWHPWGKYSGQGDWPRLSLSLSVSIKSRLSPQGCLPRAHILPADLLAISVANSPAIPVNDVVPLSEREREIVCVKESLAAKSTC